MGGAGARPRAEDPTVGAPPPRLAAWLVSRATPPADHEALLGDLEEEYRRILGDEGPRAARLFYWSEALGALVPGLRRRLGGYFDGDAVPHAPLPPRGGSMLEAVRLDLKLALRALTHQPRLAATVVLTIAVGIAANTTVFAVIDGLVLRPFPFLEPERLVTVGTAIPKADQELTFFENLSPAEYLDIARECRTLERVVAWDMGNRQVAHSGAAENLFSSFFWGDAFPTLGMAPAVGRGFAPDELRKGEKVAIVSHRYWSTRLGADRTLVGGNILVNGEPYTLVGVMPRNALIYGTDLWLPMSAPPEVFPRQRRQFQVMARIVPGRTLDDVNAELAGLVTRLAAAHGAEIPEYHGMHLVATTWTDANVRTLRPAALLLAGASLFVLGLASANVASLLLARAAARRREMCLRLALGAGRWALVRQMLSESLLLSLVGGVFGALLAALAVRSLQAALSALPLPISLDGLALSGHALAYALLASLASALAFGLAPALSASGSDPGPALRAEGISTTAGVSRLRAERFLVGLEVAGAAVLLVGCGLLLRSLDRLSRVDPGLAASEIIGFRVTLPQERYQGPEIQRFFSELQERAAAVPGAAAATVADQYPPNGISRLPFRVTGAEARREDELPAALFTSVTSSYLATTGVRLHAGRFLSDDDVVGRPPVAVVNEAAARRYFGDAALGRTVEFGSGDATVQVEVVGVVSDTHNRGLDRSAEPEIFVNMRQDPDPGNQYFVLVRARVDPLSLVPALRAQVAALDPGQPIYAVQTVRQALESQGLPRRVASSLLLVLTVVALVLAGTGVFAVVSHVAASRTREIAVRMALGATGADVRGLMVRQALVPAALGGVLGLAGAVGLRRPPPASCSASDPSTCSRWPSRPPYLSRSRSPRATARHAARRVSISCARCARSKRPPPRRTTAPPARKAVGPPCPDAGNARGRASASMTDAPSTSRRRGRSSTRGERHATEHVRPRHPAVHRRRRIGSPCGDDGHRRPAAGSTAAVPGPGRRLPDGLRTELLRRHPLFRAVPGGLPDHLGGRSNAHLDALRPRRRRGGGAGRIPRLVLGDDPAPLRGHRLPTAGRGMGRRRRAALPRRCRTDRGVVRRGAPRQRRVCRTHAGPGGRRQPRAREAGP